MLELTIMFLTLCWLLSFFDETLFPGISHAAGITDMLSVVLVLLLMFRFLT